MKNTRYLFLIAALAFVFYQPLRAQKENPFRLGFQVTQLQGDFGLGLNLAIPLPGKLPALRLAGTNHWLEAPTEAATTEWLAYQTLRLGVSGDGWPVGEQIQVYVEGGTLLIFPDEQMSGQQVLAGGYGIFGFEFFTGKARASSLFLEMGGTTAGNRAKRRPNIPAFGSGLLLSSGFRLAF
jgi:hypothetical protein